MDVFMHLLEDTLEKKPKLLSYSLELALPTAYI